jgi:hypothetical protein
MCCVSIHSAATWLDSAAAESRGAVVTTSLSSSIHLSHLDISTNINCTNITCASTMNPLLWANMTFAKTKRYNRTVLRFHKHASLLYVLPE